MRIGWKARRVIFCTVAAVLALAVMSAMVYVIIKAGEVIAWIIV